MSKGISTDLTIITKEDCKGCGACCLHMTYPFFMLTRHFKAFTGRSYTSDDTDHLREPTFDDKIIDKIPLEIREESHERKAKLVAAGINGVPCIWLNRETKPASIISTARKCVATLKWAVNRACSFEQRIWTMSTEKNC